MKVKNSSAFFTGAALIFLVSHALQSSEGSQKLLEQLQNSQHQNERECLRCRESSSLIEMNEEKKSRFIVFLSFSAPDETWKSYSQDLEKINGTFLLRGVPGNSFKTFSEKVKDLRQKGVHASIAIDSEAFENYNVDSIPTILLHNGEVHDRITGNIPINVALKMFIESGELEEKARVYLDLLNKQ